MFETYHTPSWDWQMSVDHYQGKKYKCSFCGVELEDHETYLAGGRTYCGCCKP